MMPRRLPSRAVSVLVSWFRVTTRFLIAGPSVPIPLSTWPTADSAGPADCTVALTSCSLPCNVPSSSRTSDDRWVRVVGSSAPRTWSSSVGWSIVPSSIPPDGIRGLLVGPSWTSTSRSPSNAFQATETVAPECSGAWSESRVSSRYALPSLTLIPETDPASKPFTSTEPPLTMLVADPSSTPTR